MQSYFALGTVLQRRIQASRQRRSRRPRNRQAECVVAVVERLECRILLSAQVAAFDGTYAGSYSGTETRTGQDGNVTVSPIQDADGNLITAVISNGNLTLNAPGVGAVATAKVNAQGGVSGGGTALNVAGGRFPFAFSGAAQGTNIAGTFSWISDGLPGTDVGQGSWTMQRISPPISPVLNVPSTVDRKSVV